ncbi:hypothetical protein [Symbioplanes lichenis]|uniref:hypothetical protein n=1 Tax=Symbioplanes lichenis TaxID=1629072 RepID=UPI0027392FD8|nr:hypothetical protein [Actinoplanes lichenis]
MTDFINWLGRFTVGTLGIGAFTVVNATVAWWWIGPQGAVPAGPEAGYAVRPPQIAPGVEAAAGVFGLLLAVATVAVLGWATVTRRISPRWWLVVPAVAVAGGTIGLIGRAVTAPVAGANLGAGLAVLVLGPIAVALLLWSAGWTAILVRAMLRPPVRPRLTSTNVYLARSAA